MATLLVRAFDAHPETHALLTESIFTDVLMLLFTSERDLLLAQLGKQYSRDKTDNENLDSLRPLLNQLDTVDELLRFVEYVKSAKRE